MFWLTLALLQTCYPRVLWTGKTEGLVLKSSDIIVRAFDGSKRMVHGEVDLPIKVGSHIFNSTFYIMDIRPAYSYFLGRTWIQGAGAVTSTLHKKLKYPVKGKIVVVHGEEEHMVSHLNSFRYVEMDGKFLETRARLLKLFRLWFLLPKFPPTCPKLIRSCQ